jgi:phosphate transport system ATP-binding protein
LKFAEKLEWSFKNPIPFPSLSILENVVIGMKLQGLKKRSALLGAGGELLK